jgi:hypothetical protein
MGAARAVASSDGGVSAFEVNQVFLDETELSRMGTYSCATGWEIVCSVDLAHVLRLARISWKYRVETLVLKRLLSDAEAFSACCHWLPIPLANAGYRLLIC